MSSAPRLSIVAGAGTRLQAASATCEIICSSWPSRPLSRRRAPAPPIPGLARPSAERLLQRGDRSGFCWRWALSRGNRAPAPRWCRGGYSARKRVRHKLEGERRVTGHVARNVAVLGPKRCPDPHLEGWGIALEPRPLDRNPMPCVIEGHGHG